MPNENLPVCACGIVVDLPKSRSSSIVFEKLSILLPKSKGHKQEGKGSRKQQNDRREQKTSSETGSGSSATESAKPTMRSNKHKKRFDHSRRTRSADNAESHYTYIDSGSSIVSDENRENTAIPEVLYASVSNTANANAEEIRTSRSNIQSRSQALYTAIPSMTSPPPTYDAAIAKAWQPGLPPTYEEYLHHKYAMMSRSHTPPPPWSDSTTSSSASSSNPASSAQHRNLLPNQPELREYLAQLKLDSHYQHRQQQRQQSRDTVCSALREQQIRAHHRARAMPPRSQSENRAQQQRIAAMYEDAAFCMETTVLQSAFDSAQGFALCSLM
ncbi:uncharacterized protein [Polyergus mexicanus]|uniref:uncharacterized protein isoform X1 n=1 Tax=Polyergus mexicanus TaxID=615972 RepID=UPI0038B42810